MTWGGSVPALVWEVDISSNRAIGAEIAWFDDSDGYGMDAIVVDETEDVNGDETSNYVVRRPPRNALKAEQVAVSFIKAINKAVSAGGAPNFRFFFVAPSGWYEV